MSNKLKFFIVYGNMKLDFKTLSDILLNTFDPSFDVTIQEAYLLLVPPNTLIVSTSLAPVLSATDNLDSCCNIII